MDLLKNVNFGKHYFEIACVLRESMLVNGLLTNCEVWHGLKDTDVKKLEEIDKLLLRKILQVASSCPIEALYLELGCIPLGIIIKTRRINYLHHLATRDESGMLWKVFNTQWKYPSARGEWSEQVKSDLESFGMAEELENIKNKTKFSFKALVKKQARELALMTLLKMKEPHTKMDDLDYSELAMQNYLKDVKIKVKEAKSLFKFRTRMAKFWGNFKGGRPPQQCPLCKEEGSVDTQVHSFQCKTIKINIQIEGENKDVFKHLIDEKIARTVERIERIREDLME